jgi:hypothetical protein
LEDVKKVLSILHLNLNAFGKIEPDLPELFEKIEYCCGGSGSVSSLLDDNFGLKEIDTAFEVNEDHFDR